MLAHLLPETAGEVPTELVNVAETVPIALVSPEKVNGMVTVNAPPAVTEGVFVATNQAAAAAVSDAVKDVPFNCVPEAAVNIRFELETSRGVDVAVKTTLKPPPVTFVIFTEPGVIVGASRGTVITTGVWVGNGIASLLAGLRRSVIRTSMLPATLPSCTGGSAMAAVEPAGIVTFAVVPPVANCTAVLLKFAGSPAALGVNNKVAVA